MLKGSTVKEVNVCCRQNNFTVIAWSMFSQRKTEVSYGNTIPRNFDVRFGMLRKTFKIEFGVLELWTLWSSGASGASGASVASVVKISKCWTSKKIGVDWPRPSQFRKNSSMFKCLNRKIGVDWSRQSQKRPLQRQVSFIFFRTGHPGVAEAFCTSKACPWQEV